MSMMWEPRVEVMQEYHAPILAVAQLAGCDTTQSIVGAFRYMGYNGTKAMCVVDMKETLYVAEPHVIWFPWCPPRLRMKGFKWLVTELAKHKEVFLAVLKADNNLHEHYVKNEFIRKIGVLDNLPEEAGQEIHFYQYKRSK